MVLAQQCTVAKGDAYGLVEEQLGRRSRISRFPAKGGEKILGFAAGVGMTIATSTGIIHGTDAMTLWAVSRERQKMQMALLLLVVSGIIRPASLESPHVGTGVTVALPPSDHVPT